MAASGRTSRSRTAASPRSSRRSWPRRGRRSTPRGRLLAPPFVDSHFHMDATLSLGLPRLNMSGTLLEGISLWGELKPILTHEAVIERALRYCDLAVDAGPAGHPHPCRRLRRPAPLVEALLEVKQVSPISTCNSWPSRRTGFTASATEAPNLTARSTWASTWWAASRISSAPWRTARQPEGAVRNRRRPRTDGRHPLRRDATIRCRAMSSRSPTRPSASGSAGRAAGSHLTSMHSMDNYYVSKLIPLMAEAGCRRSPIR